MKERENKEIVLRFRVNSEEYKRIIERFNESGCKDKSKFFRKMILNGLMLQYDNTLFQENKNLLSNISNNINQIARRVNSTGRAYNEDLNNIEKELNEIWQLQISIQSTLRTLKP